ncbi:3-ketosteroid reductase [Penicillium verhagenii]|nr:3-ketosteroid reductase [Penicillium verhagenii]
MNFSKTRPQTASLNIIFTTRSLRKAQDTSRRLEAHLRKNNPNPADFSRVRFLPESVDLGSLISVRACSRRLNSIFPKLDAIILNAGIGGWSGIDWPVAIFGIITDLLHQSTWPIYKLAPVGVVTDKQTPIKELEEPALGAVFCANTFGHYMLAHNVAPLLKRAKGPDGPGRVVWVSSIEASVKFFDVRDIQGLRCDAPYESSKTLTDILALTSDLPSTAPWAVDSFMSSDGDANKEETEQSVVPGQYISHPGVCATSIVPLPLPLVWAMMLAFWAARMLGSPWHTLSTYLGANSSVFLALSPKATLDAAEEPYRQAGGGKVKWGSSASRRGVGSVACTETVGWGYGGVVGTPVVEADRQRRRKRGASDLTAEQKEDFEELGRECWKQMEELRIKWDRILDEAEKRQNE